MFVGEEIRRHRELRRLSYEVVAARAGTTVACVRAIEAGRGKLDFLTVDAIVRLGIRMPLSLIVAGAERAGCDAPPGGEEA
jgi:transcriptional regulator with XRE-family HTH domain